MIAEVRHHFTTTEVRQLSVHKNIMQDEHSHTFIKHTVTIVYF